MRECRCCHSTDVVGPDGLCHLCWVSLGDYLTEFFGQKPVRIDFNDPVMQVHYDTWAATADKAGLERAREG